MVPSTMLDSDDPSIFAKPVALSVAQVNNDAPIEITYDASVTMAIVAHVLSLARIHQITRTISATTRKTHNGLLKYGCRQGEMAM